MAIAIALLSVIVGFVGLIWSADKFVLGASTTARNLGVPALVIGLTIVAFGTSAPEIFTSAAASLEGAPSLAVGNALGSNIANIGLVLAITALVCPIVIPVSLLRRELPALLGLTGICFFLLWDLQLNWVDGLVLLVILGLFGYQVFKAHTGPDGTHLSEPEEVSDYLREMPTPKALGIMLSGLLLLILSSKILVNGAIDIAQILGISELVIGLTIVALGTSLPELATSVTGALRGHHDLAVGNIIGSNILNLLLVLPVPAFMGGATLEAVTLWRDYGTMLAMTLLLTAAIFLLVRKKRDIGRITGMVLLLGYLSYTGFLLSGAGS